MEILNDLRVSGGHLGFPRLKAEAFTTHNLDYNISGIWKLKKLKAGVLSVQKRLFLAFINRINRLNGYKKEKGSH